MAHLNLIADRDATYLYGAIRQALIRDMKWHRKRRNEITLARIKQGVRLLNQLRALPQDLDLNVLDRLMDASVPVPEELADDPVAALKKIR